MVFQAFVVSKPPILIVIFWLLLPLATKAGIGGVSGTDHKIVDTIFETVSPISLNTLTFTLNLSPSLAEAILVIVSWFKLGIFLTLVS